MVINDDRTKLSNGITSISISCAALYNQYLAGDSIDRIVLENINFFNKYTKDCKFKIDYSNVYPILKHKDFGQHEDIKFYKKNLFGPIDLLFVSDYEETFRFILESDDVDFEKLEEAAFKNLNKLTNVLSRLDPSFDVYSLVYGTDYASSLIISQNFLSQVFKKVSKRDFIFSIPSNSMLLIAKNNPLNIDIIKSLQTLDEDIHKISNSIFRWKDGIYSEINERQETMLRVVK